MHFAARFSPFFRTLLDSSKWASAELRHISIVANYSSTSFASSSMPSPITYNLRDKVALVTASTDGIGLEIARRLAQSGASVVISSRKQENVDKALCSLAKTPAIKATNVAGRICHAGDADARNDLVNFTIERFGGVDIFVANAAVNPAKGSILETEKSQMHKMLDVNVISPFEMTKQVVPLMRERKGGSIIYISSAGVFNFPQSMILSPAIGGYLISKCGLMGLTKAMAVDCAKDNIRVNCVAPGLIDTVFATTIVTGPSYKTDFKSQQVIKRIGEPSEVAGLVSFLSSDDASYISGEIYNVAGGGFTKF